LQAKFHVRGALFTVCFHCAGSILQKIHEIFHFSFSLSQENQYNPKRRGKKKELPGMGSSKQQKNPTVAV